MEELCARKKQQLRDESEVGEMEGFWSLPPSEGGPLPPPPKIGIQKRASAGSRYVW